MTLTRNRNPSGRSNREPFPRSGRQVGRVVGVVGDLDAARALHEVRLGNLRGGLPRHDEASGVDVQERRELLERSFVGALEDPLALAGANVDSVQERHRCDRKRVLVVAWPIKEDLLTVGRQLDGSVSRVD